jgi:soluble lytic murein transglycosylase-like protein
MQPRVAFCNRCRGMRVGWNKRYILHRLLCKQWLSDSSRTGSLAVLAAILLLAFPEPNASVLSADRHQSVQEPSVQTTVMSVTPAVRSMEAFLTSHGVGRTNCTRLASSIVNSGRKYDLNPRLVASVIIVESRGNPFAISGKDAIGIMQIHLPTWGNTADREGINLLKIEDNIDFGARILKNYIRQFGVWEGVKRYNGFIADDRTSEQSAEDYVEKVQSFYES